MRTTTCAILVGKDSVFLLQSVCREDPTKLISFNPHQGTMTRPQISIPQDKIKNFCQKNHIKSMALFGSVLTDQFNPKSDVDFLVEFAPQHVPTMFDIVNMEEELSHIIGRHADLKTPKGISRYFRDDVMAKALTIYGT